MADRRSGIPGAGEPLHRRALVVRAGLSGEPVCVGDHYVHGRARVEQDYHRDARRHGDRSRQFDRGHGGHGGDGLGADHQCRLDRSVGVGFRRGADDHGADHGHRGKWHDHQRDGEQHRIFGCGERCSGWRSRRNMADGFDSGAADQPCRAGLAYSVFCGIEGLRDRGGMLVQHGTGQRRQFDDGGDCPEISERDAVPSQYAGIADQFRTAKHGVLDGCISGHGGN